MSPNRSGPQDVEHRAVVDAAFGVLAAVAIFVAVPGVLVLALGFPTRVQWVHASGLGGQSALDALDALAWIAWLGCCVPLIRSVVQRVRRGDTLSGAGASWVDRLIASMATAVLLVLPMTVTVAGATTPATVADRPAPTTALHSGESWVPDVRPVASQTTSVAQDTYAVQPDDSLWSIAHQLYGDGGEWEAIARLNLGTVMDDGTRFVDPSLIRPGWRLALPPGAASLAAGAATPWVPAPSMTERPPAPTTSAAVAPHGVESFAVAISNHDRSQVYGSFAASDTTARRMAPSIAVGQHRDEEFPLLALSAGMGALGAAALVRRVRRARRLGERPVGDGPLPETRSDGTHGDVDEAVDLEILFARFDGAPALDWLELANRLLALVERSARPVPDPLLFRVGIRRCGRLALRSSRVGASPVGTPLGRTGVAPVVPTRPGHPHHRVPRSSSGASCARADRGQ